MAADTLTSAVQTPPPSNKFKAWVPFSQYLNMLPAPVRDFTRRRPAAAIGIAALAGLALLTVQRRK